MNTRRGGGGLLSVQRSEHNPFGKVTIDQTIEETVNKLETCNYAQKYYVNAEFRSTCLRQLRSIIDQQSSSHHDLQSTCIKKDESDVQIVIDLLENSGTNPFSETPGDLAGLPVVEWPQIMWRVIFYICSTNWECCIWSVPVQSWSYTMVSSQLWWYYEKTNKAILAKRLEEKVSATESVSVPPLTIIDGMSLIHKLPGENRTFSEVSDHLFLLVLQAAGSSQGVVFDVYKDQSIKDAERLSRGSSDVYNLLKYCLPTE